PFFRVVTPGPTSTTIPAPSCPKITGKSPSGSAPERVNSSVWQTPLALISTRTSPALGPSRSTVTISSGLPAAYAMAALVFMYILSDSVRSDAWSLAADGPEAAGGRGQRCLLGPVAPIRNNPLAPCTAFDARGSGAAWRGIMPARSRGGLHAAADRQSRPLHPIGTAGYRARRGPGNAGLREAFVAALPHAIPPRSAVPARALRAAAQRATGPQGAQPRAGLFRRCRDGASISSARRLGLFHHPHGPGRG